MTRQNQTNQPFRLGYIAHIILLMTLLSLSGCSVFLAASSPEQPDLTVVKKGASRAEIEKEFGPPIKFVREFKGDRATYAYLGADEVNYGRAATYAVADVVTLGLAELVTAPVETLQNGQNLIEIIYDYRGRVKSFRHIKKDAPLEKPEKILGLEKEQRAGI